MSDRTTRELCELFALDLLEGEALTRFRERLASGDPALLAELAPVESLVPLIGLAAPLARPAPELKRRLFSRIGSDGFYFLLANEDGWNPTAERGVHVRPLFIDPADRSDTALVRLDAGTVSDAFDSLAGESILVASGDIDLGDLRLGEGDWRELGAGRHQARSSSGCVVFTLRPATPVDRDGLGAGRTVRANEGDWIDAGGGTFFKPLGTDRATRRDLTIARLEPGARFPEHGHGTPEELYLLNGDARTLGRDMHPGDYHRAAPGSEHDDTTSRSGCHAVLVVGSA